MWLVWRPIRFREKENKAGLRILQTKIILPWTLLNGFKVLEIYSWRFFIFNGITLKTGEKVLAQVLSRRKLLIYALP